MKKPILALALVAVSIAAALSFWLVASPRSKPHSLATAEPENAIPGIPMDADHTVGPGASAFGLTVFPIYSKNPADLGDYTTLPAAITKGEAIVRELDHSGSVNTLQIQNDGSASILVLAGTIVKGGNQDRQVGEDVVIAPHQTTAVPVFCVEHGRWRGEREGQATGGKFEAKQMLALGKVRSSGQYEKDQSQVWQNVGKVNSSANKAPATDTLLATLDDADLAKKREVLVTASQKALAEAPQRDHIVGLAYATHGKIRSARMFAGPKLYALYEETLLATASMETLTDPPSDPETEKPATAEAVVAFVHEMEAASVTSTTGTDDQRRAYKNALSGYASEVWIPMPSASASAGNAANDAVVPDSASSAYRAPTPSSTVLTKDYTSKK